MTLMTVKALLPGRTRDEAVLMLQTLPGDRVLGLLVPVGETTGLAHALGVAECPCGHLYTLVMELSRTARASVARAVLELTPDGVGARLEFACNGAETSYDCHPAHAVGLALRAGAPIYATADVIGQTCPLDRHRNPDTADPDHDPDPGPEATARWLDGVRPADFGDGVDLGGPADSRGPWVDS